jgi:hypothetical protein
VYLQVICTRMCAALLYPEKVDIFAGTCRDWWDGGSYRNCKLAAVLLTAELQRRWQPDGVVRVPHSHSVVIGS